MKILFGSRVAPYKTDKEFIEQLMKAYPNIEFCLSLDENHEEKEIVTSDVYYGVPSEKVLLAVSEKLKWVHVPGTGIDGISNQEFIDSDIILTNCPQAHTKPMADHVMGMITNLAHKLWEQRDFQREHVWAHEKYKRAGKFNDDSFVDLSDSSRRESEIKENTRMIWVESPTNPLLKLVNLVTLVKLKS